MRLGAGDESGELIVTPDSGHSAFEIGNAKALAAATGRFAR